MARLTDSAGRPRARSPRAAGLGLFGGTFDPIHIGHLIIAEEARFTLDLREVRLVPAADPPHKPARPVATAYHRLEMARLAVGGLRGITVSTHDVDRPGPHYTVELLALVRAEVGPLASLHFIMGDDSLRDLLTWREPSRIIELARIAVAPRPGSRPQIGVLEEALPGLTSRIDRLDTPHVGISATDIRMRVAAGRPIRHQVPAAVEAYIEEHGLYRMAEA